MDIIRIAICDTVLKDMLLVLTSTHNHKDKERFTYAAFRNPADLLNCASEFDLIFLFVNTDEPNALAVAEKLHACGNAPYIVLMAEDSRCAPEAFCCADRYLCKPLRADLLAEAVDSAVERMSRDRIYLRSNGEYWVVRFCDIRYLTANGHYVNCHTSERTLHVRGSLRQLMSKLPADRFASPSHGAVVALNDVRCITTQWVEMADGEKFTFSRQKRDAFVKKYRVFAGKPSVQDIGMEYSAPGMDIPGNPKDTSVEMRETKAFVSTHGPSDEETWRILQKALKRGEKLLARRSDGKCSCLCAPGVKILMALLTVLLTAFLATGAEALWKRPVQVTTQTQKSYTTVQFTLPPEAQTERRGSGEFLNEPYDPLKDILPEGYWLQEGIARRENVKYATYINDATGFIAYDISRASGISTIDTENAEQFYETEINGHWAFFVQKNGYHLVWVDQKNATYHHLLANELELEEFMEIAQLLSQSDEHE